MKTLLRSCFAVKPTDDVVALRNNYSLLRATSLVFDIPEDRTLWAYLGEFVQAYNHVPSAITLRQHFHALGEVSVVERLDHIQVIDPQFRGDFQTRLRDLIEQRRHRRTNEILKEAAEINNQGLELRLGKETVRLKGPQDALRFILERGHEVVTPDNGVKLSGEVTRDGEDFKTQYFLKAENPLFGMGQHTGIEQIDSTLNGAKKQELWVHAAFTGGLKSTLMLNWAYNQAVWYGWSSLILSLEMPYQQCRNLLYAMHSGHSKFASIRVALGLQTDPRATSVSLPYEKIRDGKLHEFHPNATVFLTDYVVPDFNGEIVPGLEPDEDSPWLSPAAYGRIHVEVADPSKSDYSMADLRQRAELLYSKDPFKMIFIDHAGLMSARNQRGDTTERLNEVIRDAKKLAMSFNRGEGIAVVALFQLSREGYKSAQKAKEKNGMALYNLTHLSYANECERSADIVTTSYVDEDLAKVNRALLQCLKSRDQKPFAPFQVRIEWDARRLFSCDDVVTTSTTTDPRTQLELLEL